LNKLRFKLIIKGAASGNTHSLVLGEQNYSHQTNHTWQPLVNGQEMELDN